MPSLRSRAFAVAVAVLAATAVGCGGSGDRTAAAPSTVTSLATSTTMAPPPTATNLPTTSLPTPTTLAATTITSTTPPGPLPPADVAPFTRGDDLAVALAIAETALADPATPPQDFPNWAWLQQQAYRDLVVHPDWQDAAREQVPPELREAFDLNLLAGTQLRRLTSPQPALPGWRIVAPPPLDELRGYYTDAETEFGVPWNVLAAIHLVETRFGRILGDSHAGARGPMQFLPSTWDAYGQGDIEDPGDAIAAAARYLVAHGAPGDLEGALWAYNHSDLYVTAVIAHAEAMDRYDHYLAVYHQWRVYYRTVDGDVLLEEGYGS
ncbi:MAG: transglycosylase SLT domain-containing protein [Acidimicrobiia bacterium]